MSWEEDMYWTHFRCTCFFSSLSPGFHDHLAIPRKFAQKMRSRLPETLVLKGPGGDTWNASLISLNEDLFLGDHGWEEFVKDHELQENDMLVFKYDGVSQFDVLVFGSKSKCEKETSYFVKRNCELGSREDNQNRVKWFKHIYWSHFRCIRFLHRYTRDFHKQLVLPRKVFENLVTGVPQTVLLRCPSGARWNVQLSVAGRVLVFKDGWEEFVNAISLNEDDVIIFSFNMESQIDVLIFDSESMCEKALSYFLKTSDYMRSDSEYQLKRMTRRRSAAYGDLVEIQDSQSTSSSDSTSSDSSRSSSKRCKTVAKKDAGKVSSSGGRKSVATHAKKKWCLSEEEQRKALRSANAVATDKSCIVVLQPSYVRKQASLVVPPTWSRVHLPTKTREVVLQVKEKTWSSSVWWSKSSIKASFGGKGWKAFVMENRLKALDVCVFTPADELELDALVLDVMIFRPSEEETPASNPVLNMAARSRED